MLSTACPTARPVCSTTWPTCSTALPTRSADLSAFVCAGAESFELVIAACLPFLSPQTLRPSASCCKRSACAGGVGCDTVRGASHHLADGVAEPSGAESGDDADGHVERRVEPRAVLDEPHGLEAERAVGRQ